MMAFNKLHLSMLKYQKGNRYMCTQKIELAVRMEMDSINDKISFVVEELESNKELIDVDSRFEAECKMLRFIENEPLKYFTTQDVVRGNAYRISSTGAGSHKFGCCEICGNHADTTYIFTRYVRRYSSIKKKDVLCHEGNAFGHKECLATLTEKAAT